MTMQLLTCRQVFSRYENAAPHVHPLIHLHPLRAAVTKTSKNVASNYFHGVLTIGNATEVVNKHTSVLYEHVVTWCALRYPVAFRSTAHPRTFAVLALPAVLLCFDSV
ncbi:hypothetical protein V5799_008646 [Amblyomma americanum]|uniref:Uncharacterized protein n=1 Tax=Amblyomma americanum TaxID=6943 RepID=A0AAQ4FCP5_AMBAM